MAELGRLAAQGQPKVNLVEMPGCLASQGCVDEAGRDFSPGLKSQVGRFQSLGHQDSFRASAPDNNDVIARLYTYTLYKVLYILYCFI